MKRIQIYRLPSNTLTWRADLDEPEATEWTNRQIALNSWGFPERQVPDPNWTPGAGQTEDDRPKITLPAEYRVDVTDFDPVAERAIANRTTAKTILSAREPASALERALTSILVDEFNTLRSWLRDYKAAVAVASTLADLKTRVAALPNMPDRTLAQLRTAIENRIDSGDVDA